MEGCRKYANVIRCLYGILAGVIALALVIISSEFENWWFFFCGCLIFALWFVIVFAYAAHLDAVAERIEQNKQIISLLSRCNNAAEAPTRCNNAAETPAGNAENQQKETRPCVSKQPKESAPVPAIENIPVKTETGPVKALEDSKPGYIVCPLCGTKQLAGRGVCFECGVKFEL